MFLNDLAAVQVFQVIAWNAESFFAPVKNMIRQDAAIGVTQQPLWLVVVITNILRQRK